MEITENNVAEELNLSLDLSSGKIDTELEPTISESVFSSEFGGFFPEQNVFIPQLD